MKEYRRSLLPGIWIGLIAMACTASPAAAEIPAPTDISAQIELQFHDRWDAYWVRVRWTPIADKGYNYITQASLEDAPNKIIEHGYVRNEAKWTFPGVERGVTYVIRVQACAESNRRSCSPWTYGRISIPKTTAEFAQIAINPPAPVKSAWEKDFEASGKEWLGPYRSSDPDHFGRIWRTPGNITSCPFVKDIARAPRDAVEATGRMIAAFDAQKDESRRRPEWVVPAEIAKAEVLAFNGRDQEAITFLSDRLARRISPIASGNESLDRNYEGERTRREKLNLAAMRIQSGLRDPLAEKTARRLVDAETKRAWIYFSQRTGQNTNSTFIARAAADRDWMIAKVRAEILGEYFLDIGRIAEAISLFDAEAQMRAHNPDSTVNSSKGGRSPLDLRARMALAEGRQSEAERLLRAYAKECDGCTSALLSLARLLILTGRSAESAGMIVRLKIDIAEKINEIIPCWGNTGSSGPYAQGTMGTESMSDAARASRPFPYDNVVEIGQILAQGTELGALLLDAGRAEDAIRVLDPILTLQRILFGITHPTSITTLAVRARAEQSLGRSDQASIMWSEWLGASSTFLSDRIWSVSAIDRRAFLRSDRVNVSWFLQALLESKDDALVARQALAVSLGRKGLLARIAADSSALARGTKDPRVRPLVEALIAARAELAAATLTGAEGQSGFTAQRKRLDAAEIALASALRSARPPWTVATVDQALASLADGEALVDFQVFRTMRSSPAQLNSPEQMLAVVASRREGIRVFRWPNMASMQAAVARYRQTLFATVSNRKLVLEASSSSSSRDSSGLTIDQASADLYSLIWQPLVGAIQDVHRIYLSPDGLLNAVPLSALRPPGGSYLVEQIEISQLSSPRDLLSGDGSNGLSAASTRALIVGAPEYGRSITATPTGANPRGNRGATLRDIYFSPLPGTLDESRKIASILKTKYSITLLNGSEARKTALTSVRSPHILHLATHGFYLDEPEQGSGILDPVEALAHSGLAFTNANLAGKFRPTHNGDDGILTALEVISMDLAGTRLVTLSACETGVGLVEAGEGVHGLARAFREAGAQAVIATLWPIADAATSAFMQAFYRRLARGDSPQAALRASQIEFLRGQTWQDPLYWAPFVLIGR